MIRTSAPRRRIAIVDLAGLGTIRDGAAVYNTYPAASSGAALYPAASSPGAVSPVSSPATRNIPGFTSYFSSSPATPNIPGLTSYTPEAPGTAPPDLCADPAAIAAANPAAASWLTNTPWYAWAGAIAAGIVILDSFNKRRKR